MFEQELKDIWKKGYQEEDFKIDLSRLKTDLKGKMDTLKRSIRRRDITEIGASIFGILSFSYLAYEIPFPATKIACILTVLWFVYVIFKLKKNKKQKQPIDLSLTFRDQITNEKANMLQEVKLLNTVLYWYVIPPVIFNVIFIWGFGNPTDFDWTPWIIEKLVDNNKLDLLPISLLMKLLYVFGIIGFNVFVIWLNKRAVKKTLMPLIENIDTVISQLEDEK